MGLRRSHAAGPLMATLEKFKAMGDAVPAEVQGELYSLLISEPAATLQANGGDCC
tara:strand:- start:1558 stop:1722 length:165 start_codon:yes stop_codon:yes gene_type:complete